jgi:phage protein D
MEKVRTPRFLIVYEGKDITSDISHYLLSVEYVDNTADNSDEVSFTVEDTEALWRGPWYPSKGDKFTLQIGYDNELFDCGKFTVDEIELSGPPDVATIRGLAAGVNSPVRTKNSKAFEGQSLRQIAEEIAAKYGYEIIDGEEKRTNRTVSFELERNGITRLQTQVALSTFSMASALMMVAELRGLADMLRRKGKRSEASQLDEAISIINQSRAFLATTKNGPLVVKSQTIAVKTKLTEILTAVRPGLVDTTSTVVTRDSVLDGIQIQRVTQDRETDLEFLRRVAADYGILFSLRDDKMIFISIYEVQNAAPISTLDRKDLLRYSIKDKATKVYKGARVRHHDIKQNKVISKEVAAKDFPEINSEYEDAQDILEIHEKVENQKQAEEKAKAALHNANGMSQEGSITIEGNPLLVAGNNFTLTGMKNLNGKFRITRSTHRISRGGYITEAEIKRI